MAAKSGSKRLKLWQLPHYMHCPVIGTCLTIGELRKVQRQCGLQLAADHSDYQLHACLVGLAAQKKPCTVRWQKLLDAKYQRWIKAYGQLHATQQREAFWHDALKAGELSGAFWALLSHRDTGSDLCDKALGNVHMLSHLQGAANRADLRHTVALEREVADLQERLAHLQLQHQQHQQQSDRLLAAQDKALQALRQQQPARETDRQFREQLDESRRQCRLLNKRQEWAFKQLQQRDRRLVEFEQRQEQLQAQLREAHQERDAVEETLNTLLQQYDDAAQGDAAARLDLKGRKLAYIGGRTSLYPRLKAFVEAHNGRLLHHDGGLEDNRADLCQCLSGADLVFCPVDCISHDACLRVKKFCKRHAKPFVPLRSASLSAFTHRLRESSAAAPATGIAYPGGTPSAIPIRQLATD